MILSKRLSELTDDTMARSIRLLLSLIITTYFTAKFPIAYTLGLSSSQRQLIVCGRPILIVPSVREELHPTLVLLGGIAQTISSWQHHLHTLSKNRQVIVYECLGQGETLNEGTGVSGPILENVTLPFQAELLLCTLNKLVDPNSKIDIAGFSFGGRVAMAAACLKPERIRRLHLTGVAADRSDYGHMAIQAFKENIHSDPSLRSFAWSILLASYSSSYLRNLPGDMLDRFLSNICTNNSPHGLYALLQQAEINDKTNPWHVCNMAGRIGGTNIHGRLCVGDGDQMAPVDQVKLLNNVGWTDSDFDVIPNCGHAAIVEAPRAWKDSLLSFLDADREE